MLQYNPVTSLHTYACLHVKFIIGAHEIYHWHKRVTEFGMVLKFRPHIYLQYTHYTHAFVSHVWLTLVAFVVIWTFHKASVYIQNS